MTDSSLHSSNPAVLAFPTGNGGLAETGAIARVLASPSTSEFVRRWLSGAIGRDPVLAYHEAVTLAGMLELLTCEEARSWLLPALTAALQQDLALKGGEDADGGLCLREPANSRGPSIDQR